jgi:type II secretory pathway pseudopilin PulG
MSTAPSRPSSRVIAALVLSVLGFCFLPLAIVGTVLAILALRASPGGPGPADRTLAIVALVLGPVGMVSGLGTMAAIAIPSFVRYVHRAHAAEAQAQVSMLARAVATSYEDEHFAPDGTVTHELPASLPPTPPGPGCEEEPWPAGADPGWQALGFRIERPTRYRYELLVAPDRRSFVARATGDLDCDGLRARFEIRGTVENDAVRLDPMLLSDELE